MLFSLEYHWPPWIMESRCLSAVDSFPSPSPASSYENTQKWKVGIFLIDFFRSTRSVMEKNFSIPNILGTTYLLSFQEIIFVLITTMELRATLNCDTQKSRRVFYLYTKWIFIHVRNLYMVYILYTMIKGCFVLWLISPGNFNIYYRLLNDGNILLQMCFHDDMSS